MMKGPVDESLCRAEVARVEIMHPQYDDPLRLILEGIEDKRCYEAASLKKLLDEPDFFMEPMMETVLEASMMIPIHPDDQEKTTFTCPYGTFAYRRMPLNLCNAPATFQRCMMAIFSNFIGDFMEVYMDDFSVYETSFEACFRSMLKQP
ncbi:uncharacterized protein LOC130807889 [Amaranthus tricolor]|uniref:uncharacterized protein LOC130807889 n=1 Tax=Amaranthus tricolor TaxID=29722 RepID=UPI00258691D1|nr:uncharacterized protein LOC130807889 [Amaranthus tricolor]